MFVSKSEAEGFIKKYLEIKQNLSNKLSPDLDLEARKYYEDPQKSFVFKREFIDGLFDGTDANALRIYYGAHRADELPVDGEPPAEPGEPTLVLVACKIEDDNITVTNKRASQEKSGSQHPGPRRDSGGGITVQEFDLDTD